MVGQEGDQTWGPGRFPENKDQEFQLWSRKQLPAGGGEGHFTEAGPPPGSTASEGGEWPPTGCQQTASQTGCTISRKAQTPCKNVADKIAKQEMRKIRHFRRAQRTITHCDKTAWDKINIYHNIAYGLLFFCFCFNPILHTLWVNYHALTLDFEK